MNKNIVSIILMSVISIMLISTVTLNVEAKLKLKDYTDPYNRYTIKYPANWDIKSEPVHTENNLYEVPFQVGNNKGSTISVIESVKDASLSLREYTSYIQNSVPVITTRVLNPVTCTSETVCFYYYAVTFGFSEVYNMATYYSSGNKVFTVSASFNSYESMGTEQFNSIEESFSFVQDPAVTRSNNYATITKNSFNETTTMIQDVQKMVGIN